VVVVATTVVEVVVAGTAVIVDGATEAQAQALEYAASLSHQVA
jgi:hypothetical protein